MTPGCLNNNCTGYGAQNAFDNAVDVTSMAVTAPFTNPAIQLDLGSLRADVYGVRLTAHPDAALALSQNLTVYVSASPRFVIGYQCLPANDSSAGLSGNTTVVCPFNIPVRYITVAKQGVTVSLGLAEITPMTNCASTSTCPVERCITQQCPAI